MSLLLVSAPLSNHQTVTLLGTTPLVEVAIVQCSAEAASLGGYKIRLGCFALPFPSVKRLGDLRFRLGIPYNPLSLKNQCILVATRAGRGSKPSNQWVNRGLANLQIPEVSMPFWEGCPGRLIPRQPCETCLGFPKVSIKDIRFSYWTLSSR